MLLQNTFLETCVEHGLPEDPLKIPIHFLTHASMERFLLETNPFCFYSYIYAQALPDFAPVEFHLDGLSRQVLHHIASKRFISNTILNMQKDLCYKWPGVQVDASTLEPASAMQLPAAFSVPLTTEALTALQMQSSHVQLEQLRETSAAYTV